MSKFKNVKTKPLRNNLSGKRFGMLEVISYAYHDSNDKVWYNCKCDCGNITDVKAIAMTSEGKSDCGCKRRKELFNPNLEVGKKYNDWEILEYTGKNERFVHLAKAKCLRCGTIKDGIHILNIVRGHSKNCGCFRAEIAGDNNKLDLIGKVFGYLTVVEFIGVNNNKKRMYNCRCECGNYVTYITQELTSGKISCGCKGSTGESHIALYLEDKGIPYIKEKVEYINDSKHRFDFYIPKIRTFIEFDGEYHYVETDTNNLNDRRNRDLEKDLYCYENNFRLIRIPYYYIGKISTILDRLLFKKPVKVITIK